MVLGVRFPRCCDLVDMLYEIASVAHKSAS
jgi:hypothetical protein